MQDLDSMTNEELRKLERSYRNQAEALEGKANRCQIIRIGREASMILNEAAASKRRAMANGGHDPMSLATP